MENSHVVMWGLVEDLLRVVNDYDYAHADLKKKSANPSAVFSKVSFYDPKDSLPRLLQRVQDAVDRIVEYAPTYQLAPEKNPVVNSIVSRVVIADLNDKEKGKQNAAYDMARLLGKASNTYATTPRKEKNRFFFDEKNAVPAYVPMPEPEPVQF